MKLTHPSWPGLSRPSTSCFLDAKKTWMRGIEPGMTMKAVAVVLIFAFSAAPAYADAAFTAFLQSLWPQAASLGVSRATFDNATRGLEPDLALPDLVLPGRPQKPPPGQPEFVETPADYLKQPAIERLAVEGRKLYAQYRGPLAAIEREFGVPPGIVLAIFGRETDYGHVADTHDAIQVLATQAYYGKRKEKFAQEFLLALKILDEGKIARPAMKSSWAGAMGLTQFLPSDYLKYAVDFEHTGRADIWTSVPDALASAAKQLVGDGWQRGVHWAYEVHPPANVDCTIGVPDYTLPIAQWLKRGFVPAYGRVIAPAEQAEPASLLQPAGLYGPSFLATANYFAIKQYNFSDLYVLFVGHLERPHRRSEAADRHVRDAVGQSGATADRRSRPHAADPHRARLLPRQDRRQGRHADPRRARRLSEEERLESRLLAERSGVAADGSERR